MRAAPLVLLLVVACDCGDDPSSDEERLREAIDTSSVHVYVAAKAALADGDGDAAEKLRALSTTWSEVARGEASPQQAAGSLSLTELASVGRAVWNLRDSGARLVRNGEDPPPLLPVLLRATGEEALAGRIHANDEHAILLLSLFALKFHPGSPAPLPDEILLYEASRTRPDDLSIDGLAPPVRGVRAFVYGTHELCDLASRDAAELDDLTADELEGLVATLGGTSLSEPQTRVASASLQALAHGATGHCYLDREEDERAREELTAFCDAAEAAGFEGHELTLTRAWLAHHAGDPQEAAAMLRELKRDESLDATTQDQIDEVLGYLEHNDGGALERYFDRAFFAAFTVRVVFDRLEDAGIGDAIARSPVYETAYGFVVGAGRAIGGAGDAATGAASGLAESLRGED